MLIFAWTLIQRNENIVKRGVRLAWDMENGYNTVENNSWVDESLNILFWNLNT